MESRLSDVFGLIAVINLPDRTDRRREAEKTLQLLGVTPERGSVEFFPGQRVSTTEGFPNLGARGCFLSHLNVLRAARDRGMASVLVFEDDFELSRANAEALTALLPSIEAESWGLLYLGHRLALGPVGAPMLSATSEPIVTSHAYAVRASILPALLGYLEGCLVRPPGDPVGGPMHFDGALTMFRAAHTEALTLVAQPSLVAQRSSRSDVTFRRFEQLPLVKQALSVGRRFANFLRSRREQNQ